MSRGLYRIGRWAATHPWRVVGAWVFLVVALAGAGQRWGDSAASSFAIPGSESQRAFDLLDDRFPAQSGSTAWLVFHAPTGTLADADAMSAIEATLDEIRGTGHVVAVASPLDEGAERLVSSDATIAYAEVRYDIPASDFDDAIVDALDVAAAAGRDAGLQVELGGDAVDSMAEKEPPGSELIGLGVAVVVLLVAFGSLIAMGLPLLSAVVGLGIGLSAIRLLGHWFEFNSAAPILASMIGLGVGIDYSLFVVTRHRHFLHDGMTVAESVARANATAGSAVVFAGATVVVAILGLQIAGLPLVTWMGIAAAITVAVMVAVAVVLLPALLGIAGERIDRFAPPGLKPNIDTTGRRTLGARWATAVAARPLVSAIVGASVLLVLTVPLFDLRLGSTDAGNEPTTSTARRSYDLLTEGFGAGFNGPLTIVVDLNGAAPQMLPSLLAAIDGDPNVVEVLPAVINPVGDTAVLTAYPTSKPQDAATTELVHRLRRDVIPSVVDQGGGAVFVTGSTAAFIDLTDKITARLPWFIAGVVGLSFVLLMTVFRSILIALKAAIMNLFAIGAAYGALVAVFQWQWGGSLLGVHESLPIVSIVPMIMFAILFGLSMDYEVFILARVREEWLKTGDTRQSVVDGLSATARVITSAALIMISVFGAFLLSDDPLIKMFGFGLAFAVFIDATIVRMVLVPATMELLGDRNWWLPGWLDRILPDISVDGEQGLPEPEYRSAAVVGPQQSSPLPAVEMALDPAHALSLAET